MTGFDTGVQDAGRRAHAEAIFAAGVAAVDPRRAVATNIGESGGDVVIRGRKYRPRRVYVIGAGKAAESMALGVEDQLSSMIYDGLILGSRNPEPSSTGLERIEALPVGHPEPDQAGLTGTASMLELLAETDADDLVIALISGGASSMLVAPSGQLTLEQLRRTNRALLSSGMPIAQMNTIRRHLSRVKGGRLSEHTWPARCHALVVSDVISDSPSMVGSGPFSPDSTTPADALRLVASVRDVPTAVLEHLAADADRRIEGHLLERVQVDVVCHNRIALNAAAAAARRLGYETDIVTASLAGEAREVGSTLGRRLHTRVPHPRCELFGGETTVTLTRRGGVGGRNQEVALAAAIELDGVQHVGLLCAGTDGVDGPTPAGVGPTAGAWVDGETAPRLRHLGIEPAEALRRHDSNAALTAIAATHITGPTGTNVMDLAVLLYNVPT